MLVGNQPMDTSEIVILIPNDKHLVGVSVDSSNAELRVWNETNQTFHHLFHIVGNLTDNVRRCLNCLFTLHLVTCHCYTVTVYVEPKLIIQSERSFCH